MKENITKTTRFITYLGLIISSISALLTLMLSFGYIYAVIEPRISDVEVFPKPQFEVVSIIYLLVLLVSSLMAVSGFYKILMLNKKPRARILISIILLLTVALPNFAGSGFFYLPIIVLLTACYLLLYHSRYGYSELKKISS